MTWCDGLQLNRGVLVDCNASGPVNEFELEKNVAVLRAILTLRPGTDAAIPSAAALQKEVSDWLLTKGFVDLKNVALQALEEALKLRRLLSHLRSLRRRSSTSRSETVKDLKGLMQVRTVYKRKSAGSESSLGSTTSVPAYPAREEVPSSPSSCASQSGAQWASIMVSDSEESVVTTVPPLQCQELVPVQQPLPLTLSSQPTQQRPSSTPSLPMEPCFAASIRQSLEDSPPAAVPPKASFLSLC